MMVAVAVHGWSASSGSTRSLAAAWRMGGTDRAMSAHELNSDIRSATSPLAPRQLRGPTPASPSGSPKSAVECSHWQRHYTVSRRATASLLLHRVLDLAPNMRSGPVDAGTALAWAVDPAGKSGYLA